MFNKLIELTENNGLLFYTDIILIFRLFDPDMSNTPKR